MTKKVRRNAAIELTVVSPVGMAVSVAKGSSCLIFSIDGTVNFCPQEQATSLPAWETSMTTV